jgi:hypothetical protein
MKQFAIVCAALVGLRGIALAQNEAPADAPPPPPAADSPAAEAGPGGEMMPGMPYMRHMDEGMRHMDEGMRHMEDGGRFDRHHWRDMRRGGRDGPRGAMFAWRTEDGARFMFRCAPRDTTQECVDALMPLIERVAPGDAN